MQSLNLIIKFFAVACFLSLGIPVMAHAQELPAIISEQAAAPLEKVGSGAYRKLGFTIYHATLWAPGGDYNKNGPYALQVRYTRNLSQETVSNTVIDNIREQKVADEATLRGWQDTLLKTLPAIKTKSG